RLAVHAASARLARAVAVVAAAGAVAHRVAAEVVVEGEEQDVADEVLVGLRRGVGPRRSAVVPAARRRRRREAGGQACTESEDRERAGWAPHRGSVSRRGSSPPELTGAGARLVALRWRLASPPRPPLRRRPARTSAA